MEKKEENPLDKEISADDQGAMATTSMTKTQDNSPLANNEKKGSTKFKVKKMNVNVHARSNSTDRKLTVPN